MRPPPPAVPAAVSRRVGAALLAMRRRGRPALPRRRGGRGLAGARLLHHLDPGQRLRHPTGESEASLPKCIRTYNTIFTIFFLQNAVMFDKECTPDKVDFWTNFIDMYYNSRGSKVKPRLVY